MHLIWENLIPNLIEFWTGAFKDLDHEGKDYLIEPRIWGEIGVTTATSRATIPSAFGAPVPNIATKQHEISAEMYANWTLFIAPIVLHGKILLYNIVMYHKFGLDSDFLRICSEIVWAELIRSVSSEQICSELLRQFLSCLAGNGW